MCRLIFLALLVAVPLFALGPQAASACRGGYGYGYSSQRPVYRAAYADRLCFCRLWLARPGMASGMAVAVRS